MEYGKRLNPEHSLRTPKGIKGTRQKVIVTHNPSEIDQAQELLVRFPNLGSDDVIIPGMANLSFNIELTSAVDANRTLVSNIGRAIVKKLAVKFKGNEIMSVDNFDMLAITLNLDELNNSVHLKDGRPSNSLLTYYVTDDKDFTHFELQNPQYKKLKNEEFTSLNLRITDQNNNIITDGPQVTVVLHVHDRKI